MDLNADVGEGDDDDDAILAVVTSASVACGVHAGHPVTMRRTVEAAVRHGVVVGAHPSYPDRAGFGRRPMALPPAQITEETLAQIGALDDVARSFGTRVRYVKPHGALYHRMAHDAACALAVADAARRAGDLVVLAPSGSAALSVVGAAGVAVAAEAFADRAYDANGRLVDRTEDGALLIDGDEVASRAVDIALRGRVPARQGPTVAVSAASICVHSDTPGAAALAGRVRTALVAAGVTLEPFAL